MRAWKYTNSKDTEIRKIITFSLIKEKNYYLNVIIQQEDVIIRL